MKTVEPIYVDLNHKIEGSGVIEDNAIARIYGAIKKYGAFPEETEELKKYILQEAQYIGK